jgi:hypothetical protein
MRRDAFPVGWAHAGCHAVLRSGRDTLIKGA